MYSARRHGPSNHVLETPPFLSVVLIIQFIVAITLLGLSGYGVSQYAFSGSSLTLFTSLVTMIITSYILIATELHTIIYNYWAILGLHIFLVIFWLCSFAVAASDAAAFDNMVGFCYFEDGHGYNNVCGTYRNVLKATAVFGAFEFLLFIMTLAVTGDYLHIHRKTGGHCMPYPNNGTHHHEMKGSVSSTIEQRYYADPGTAPTPPV